MTKIGHSCKNFRNHSNVDPNKFYLEIKGFYEHSLTLPSIIAEVLKGHIHETVKLKGPSGNTWHAKLVKSNGRFVLQSGWRDFVTANQIGQEDILFYEYSGNFSFDVLILGSNGCANIKSYFARKMETETETEMEAQELSESAEHTSESSEKISTSSTDSSESSEDDFKDTRMKTKKVEKNGEGTSRSARMKLKRERCDESDDQKDSNSSGESVYFIMSHKVKLSNGQRKKVLQLCREVQSGNPYFVDVITTSNVRYKAVIGIPLKFWDEYHLPDESQNAKLYYKKKVWDMWYYCKSDRKQFHYPGWISFVRDNNLQEGDICLFELLKNQEEFSFRVHISRK